MAKMNHSTVADVSPVMGADTIKTGGEPAKSDSTRLKAAFSGSPIHNSSYTAAVVKELQQKVLSNTVDTADAATAQSYYGFSSTASTEAIPSSADLSYAGAPDIDKVTMDSGGIYAIASPYMPNLVPPVNMNPTFDNPTKSVLTTTQAHAGTTPFVGDGLKNPSATSLTIKSNSKSAANPAGDDADADAEA